MNPFEAVLEKLHQRSAQERELMSTLSSEQIGQRLDQLMLPVGPDSGRFLNLLIKAGGCRAVLELGTSVGYSTLWLAEAVRHTGGRVTTLEQVADKQRQARAHVEQAGLTAQVEFVLGDALPELARLKGPFDFVLLDIWKDLYIPALEALLPKLTPGGLVLADNMLQPEISRPEAEAYRARVRTLPGLESVLVPIGSGMEMTRKVS